MLEYVLIYSPMVIMSSLEIIIKKRGNFVSEF